MLTRPLRLVYCLVLIRIALSFKMKSFFLVIGYTLLLSKFSSSNILVYSRFNNQIVEEFYDLPAIFGAQLPAAGYKVYAVAGEPEDGCSGIIPPPNGNVSIKYAVILARYNCQFEDKVRHAQQAGYHAAIIHNVGSNDLETMSAKNYEDIRIPSVFVGETTGKILQENYQGVDNYELVLNDELPFNINTHLILPFSIVVGLCFVIMVGFMIVKCIRDRRRAQRHRLPNSVLKTIPTIKYNKSLTYETCAICLDDYTEGEKLRVLPCEHAYHSKCIDVWLTKNRRTCPICKRKIVRKRPIRQPRHRSSDDSSDSETDDTRPLLNPVEHSNNHGTFDQSTRNDDGNTQRAQPGQRVNPFDRSPNLPPNILQQTASLNPLARFLRLFKWNASVSEANTSQIVEDQEESATASTSNNTNAVNLPNRQLSSSSNNLMNANLSGSFRDSDEEQHSSTIYEPANQSRVPAAAGGGIAQPSPSNIRLGVAAIPNMEFCLSPQPQSTHNSTNKDFFNIV